MNSNDFLKEGIGEDAQAMALDHEVQMARQECYHAAEDAITLHKLLRHMSEQQGLEGWVSAKITLAADYLNTVREHLEYQLMAGAEQAAPISVVTVAEGTITHEDLAAITEAPVTKKPQPYNDPKWAKNLPKEKLDALAGARRKKEEPDVVSQAKFAEIVNRPKMQAALKRKGMAEGQLNEYLVQAGMPVKDVLALNLFQDTGPDGQEGMADDPRWRRLMKKYQPIANMLAKKIIALGKNRRLSDAEANAIEQTWYDGSDAYDDMEVEYLADYYDQQIDIIEALLAGNITDEEFGDLEEADPRNFDSDVDYRAAQNAPVKRRSAPSDYPYSPEEDDAYFREIFRKKREAAKKAEQDKEQGVAEGSGFDKWADDRAASQLHKLKPGMVQDRKTGKWYDPKKEFDKKMNSPEVMAQMKRMAQKEGVAEGEEMSTFSALKDWRVWDVTVMNNFYRGKYADYGPRLYSVVASSPEEARQVIINNADYVLQDLLSRKLQNGKKVLPRSSALPIEDKRVGKAQPGTITTMGLKKMLTPDGVQSFKFTNGKIVDGAHMQGGEEQGVAEDEAKLKAYKRASAGDAINRQNIARHTGKADPKIAKRNAGQERAEKRLGGISQGISETSAGSVAGVVAPVGKNKAKVGSLFGGTYKQKKVAK